MLRSLLVIALASCVAVAAADAAVSIDPYAEAKRDSPRAANDTVELRSRLKLILGPGSDVAQAVAKGDADLHEAAQAMTPLD